MTFPPTVGGKIETCCCLTQEQSGYHPFNSSSPCTDVTLLFGFPKHLFRLPTVLANVVTARRFLK